MKNFIASPRLQRLNAKNSCIVYKQLVPGNLERGTLGKLKKVIWRSKYSYLFFIKAISKALKK